MPTYLFLRRLRRSPAAFSGLTLVILLVLTALFAPWLAPHDPNWQDAAARLQEPGAGHWLGTVLQMPLVGFGLKHAENLPVMDSYSVFMNEVNNRTKTIVMSERFPEKQKKVLSLLLAGHSWNTVRSFSKRG